MTVLNENYREFIYISMLSKFLKAHGRTIKDNNDDILPHDWESINDNVLKTEILMESLNKKIHVTKTSLYQDMLAEKNKKNIII